MKSKTLLLPLAFLKWLISWRVVGHGRMWKCDACGKITAGEELAHNGGLPWCIVCPGEGCMHGVRPLTSDEEQQWREDRERGEAAERERQRQEEGAREAVQLYLVSLRVNLTQCAVAEPSAESRKDLTRLLEEIRAGVAVGPGLQSSLLSVAVRAVRRQYQVKWPKPATDLILKWTGSLRRLQEYLDAVELGWEVVSCRINECECGGTAVVRHCPVRLAEAQPAMMLAMQAAATAMRGHKRSPDSPEGEGELNGRTTHPTPSSIRWAEYQEGV